MSGVSWLRPIVLGWLGQLPQTVRRLGTEPLCCRSAAAATRDDTYRIERQLKPSFRAKGMGWDHPLITPQPLLAYFLLTVHCATHTHF